MEWVKEKSHFYILVIYLFIKEILFINSKKTKKWNLQHHTLGEK